ncbi:MAG: hypothetical protein KKF62_14050 [Bacteroidetes bacterium]|nr:hypothetical protein [Bacteroidota bacterium]MBU1114210.1 hypothetical protein [Bacteroidota bacterium]MBU1797019.1 hypothetical protein [Bacteroidota bacterium]
MNEAIILGIISFIIGLFLSLNWEKIIESQGPIKDGDYPFETRKAQLIGVGIGLIIAGIVGIIKGLFFFK